MVESVDVVHMVHVAESIEGLHCFQGVEGVQGDGGGHYLHGSDGGRQGCLQGKGIHVGTVSVAQLPAAAGLSHLNGGVNAGGGGEGFSWGACRRG